MQLESYITTPAQMQVTLLGRHRQHHPSRPLGAGVQCSTSRVDQYRSRATYFESQAVSVQAHRMTPNSEARVTAPSMGSGTQHHPVSEHIPRDRGLREKRKLLDLAKYTPESRHRDWHDYLGHCPLEHRSSCASLTQGQWSPRWHG